MIILREKRMVEKGALFFSDRCKKEEPVLDFSRIRKLGFAVDIGTTTVAVTGFAFLDEGDEPVYFGSRTEKNAQKDLGKDVVMRIMHAVSGKAKQLQERIVCQIERMAGAILEDVGQKGENDFSDFLSRKQSEQDSGRLETGDALKTEFVIVGNTTMCHLFLGKSVEGLKGAPFQPDYQGNYLVSGEEIGCERFSKAEIFVLSGIASHVGSDALAVLCDSGMQDAEKNILAVDLGTNAEILLNHRGRLSCCSAAAGPAFEGRGIASGKNAGAGVITGMKAAVHTGNLLIDYVPGGKICGICGSGLIDALAELRKIGILEKDGYLLSKEEAEKKESSCRFAGHIGEEGGKRFFVLYDGDSRVALTQEDIRNLQLAKGAIAAAVRILLEEAGLEAEDLDFVILSGVLGKNIRMENANTIGLLPTLPKERYRFIGNGALDGAVALLKDMELRSAWEKTATQVRHVELAEKKNFQTYFMQSMDLEESFKTRRI